MGTQNPPSQPNFRFPFKTEILTLEIVTLLLLIEIPTLSQFFSIQVCLRDIFYIGK